METNNLFGFINIYKPVGMTSHDVVAFLRRLTKIKQIGHAGTLDPFAEGVLPIAVGKAARLIEYLEDDKAYIGRFCFGRSTTTFDIDGETVNTFDTKLSAQDFINLPLPKGEIEQTPPIYSAKKVNGKKLYEYARAGEDVEIESRIVNIYESKVLSFDTDEQCADILIECSKGTYIRTIADELGKSINNGCYLSKLKRIKSGRFELNTSVKLEDLNTSEDVEYHVLNPLDYLNLPYQELNEVEFKRAKRGMTVYNRINEQKGFVLLVQNRNIAAISKVEKGELRPVKVFI